MNVRCKIGQWDNKWSQIHFTIVDVNCITATVYSFFRSFLLTMVVQRIVHAFYTYTNNFLIPKSKRPNEVNKNSWTICFLICSVKITSHSLSTGRHLVLWWFSFEFLSRSLFLYLRLFTTWTIQHSHHLISGYNNIFIRPFMCEFIWKVTLIVCACGCICSWWFAVSFSAAIFEPRWYFFIRTCAVNLLDECNSPT